MRRRRGRTTIRVLGGAVAPDLVRRDFRPEAPDRLWVADLTYLRSWEGWLYLAFVVDCCSPQAFLMAPAGVTGFGDRTGRTPASRDERRN